MMEGSSNYLMNVNLDIPNTTYENFTIDLPVFTDGEQLKVNATDVYNRFNDVNEQINATELSSNKKAKIADYKVKSSDSQNIQIEVAVALGDFIFEHGDPTIACYQGGGVDCYIDAVASCDNPNLNHPIRPQSNYDYPDMYTVTDWINCYNYSFLCASYEGSFFVNVTELVPDDEKIEFYAANHTLNDIKRIEAAIAGYEKINETICAYEIPQFTSGTGSVNIYNHLNFKYIRAYSEVGGSVGGLNSMRFGTIKIGKQVNYNHPG